MNFPMGKCSGLLIGAFSFLLQCDAYALNAKVITGISLHGVANAEIDRQRDHIAISIEDGWLSKDSNVISDIFSKAKGAAFRINGQIQFGPGDQQKTDDIIEIRDAANSMSRPLGFQGAIFSDLPADIDRLDLNISISVTKDSRIAQLISGLTKQKENLPSEIFSAPWLGYATAVGAIADALFDTSGENVPFQGQIRLNFRVPIKQQFILLVAPNADNDAVLGQAAQSDFTYDQGRVLFKGKAIANWSYLLIKIQKADRRTVARRWLGSREPWATVIQTQLVTIPTQNAKDSSRMSTVADGVLSALRNLQQFLSGDKSYSNFDRAEGLYYYANFSIETITAACAESKIQDCPLSLLKQYRQNVASAFGIPVAVLDQATRVAQLDAAAFALFLQGQLGLQPNSANLTKLPTLKYWNAITENKPHVAEKLLKNPSVDGFREAVTTFVALSNKERTNPCSEFNPYTHCVAVLDKTPFFVIH